MQLDFPFLPAVMFPDEVVVPDLAVLADLSILPDLADLFFFPPPLEDFALFPVPVGAGDTDEQTIELATTLGQTIQLERKIRSAKMLPTLLTLRIWLWSFSLIF